MRIVRVKAKLRVSKSRDKWGGDGITSGGELGELYEDVSWGLGKTNTFPKDDSDCWDIKLFDFINGARWIFEAKAAFTELSPLEVLAHQAE